MKAMNFLDIIERQGKPREQGLTLCHDPGIGSRQMEAHLESVADFVDYIKLRNLTPRLWSESFIRSKIEVMRRYDVGCLVGGVYGELAYLQGKWNQAAEYIATMGFTAFELSENYVEFGRTEKQRMVRRLVDLNIHVLCEWGRKTPISPLDPRAVAGEVEQVLALGAKKVIIEENEVNAVLGLDGGGPEAGRLDSLFALVGMEPIIIESTHPSQQLWLLKEYGPTINLGANIRIEDVPLLEAHRRGLGLKVDWFALDPWLEAAGLPTHRQRVEARDALSVSGGAPQSGVPPE